VVIDDKDVNARASCVPNVSSHCHVKSAEIATIRIRAA
jgi:hypothetical protein